MAKFLESIAAADALITLEAGYPDPPDDASRSTVQGLRGGAVVMMVAAFEVFVKEVIVEYCTPLTRSPLPTAFSDLPEPMQIKSIFGSLERAMRGPRHGAPRGKRMRLADIRWAAQRVVDGILDLAALSDTQSNPDARTVGDLLRDLGIVDPFNVMRPGFDAVWPKPEATSFLQDKLTEIVGRRHLVAHTADALKVSRQDLPLATEFLRVLAPIIEATVATHLATL